MDSLLVAVEHMFHICFTLVSHLSTCVAHVFPTCFSLIVHLFSHCLPLVPSLPSYLEATAFTPGAQHHHNTYWLPTHGQQVGPALPLVF